MRTCPACQTKYPDDMEFCSRDATPLPPPLAATQFDLSVGLTRRYRIVRRLGQGGMGTVFLAEQIAVGSRSVALKILRRTLLEDPEFLQRFQDEASSTGRIHHQNVVTVHECGQTDDGSPYIAMEYLDGESLRQYLKREGPIPLETAADILQQAARGLNAAHKLGIIHRDLKPDNIFLTHDDEGRLLVKIVDFGIAKMRESTTHTMTGLAVGTPTYMSVEQASGMRSDEMDGRSDIYSLGIVAYEMIAGRVPFQADTPLAYVQKHLIEPPAPLSLARPDLNIPPQVEEVVMKALKKDRDERYSTAPEFARAFAEAASGRVLPESDRIALQTPQLTPVVPTPKSPEKKRPRSSVLLAAAAAVLVLAVSAAAWYMLRAKPEPNQSVAPPAPEQAQSVQPQALPATPQVQLKRAEIKPNPPTPHAPPPSLEQAIELFKTDRYSEALPVIQQSAANGNRQAQRYLATMYRNGAGLTQDYGQARYWYEKAATAGDAAAMNDLGHLYEHGLGVAPDLKQAREWYQKAAAGGSAPAATNLSRLSGNQPADRDAGRPASPKALGLLQKARAEWQSGNHNGAIADVSNAISDSPSWPAAYLFRAEWEFSTGNTKLAFSDYNACIERKPLTINLIAAYRGRAKLRESLGDAKGAEADREKVRRLQDENR